MHLWNWVELRPGFYYYATKPLPFLNTSLLYECPWTAAWSLTVNKSTTQLGINSMLTWIRPDLHQINIKPNLCSWRNWLWWGWPSDGLGTTHTSDPFTNTHTYWIEREGFGASQWQMGQGRAPDSKQNQEMQLTGSFSYGGEETQVVFLWALGTFVCSTDVELGYVN